MRKLIIAILGIVVSYFCAPAEVQTGVVKTRGRLQSDGSVIRGKQLAGVAVVLTNGANSTVSDADGMFSVTVPSGKFYLKKVVKKDYQIVDPDVLSKSYEYQRNPLVLVMESLRQIEADKLAYTRQIRRTLDRDIERKQQEIEELMQSNKITEEKYINALRKLNEYVDNNERLVAEMAERYAKIDYDSIDDFQRRVAAYILAGELTKADSLINTRGSLESRGAEIDRIREANAQRKEEIAREQDDLDKSEAMAAKLLEAFGADCYSKAEVFKMRHENDSAAYYLRLRADKDPHNVVWQLQAGVSVSDLADYDLALQYYNLALEGAKQQGNNALVALSLNNIGADYQRTGKYVKAIEHYIQTLEFFVKTFGTEHPVVAATLNNISAIFSDGGEYAQALEYSQRVLDIWTKTYGSENTYVAMALNNIGAIYERQGEHAQALDYFKRSLDCSKKALGDEHTDVAISLNNIGMVYCEQKEYPTALDYFKQALNIWTKALGDDHPYVATALNNIGLVYHYQGDYAQALDYYRQALDIREKTYGSEHSDVVASLNNIAYIYEAMGDKEKTAEYRQRSEAIRYKLNNSQE